MSKIINLIKGGREAMHIKPRIHNQPPVRRVTLLQAIGIVLVGVFMVYLICGGVA